MTRGGGISYAKRRCSEFRQLLRALQKEWPDVVFPGLPPKKLPGCRPSLEKRSEILLALLNFLVAKKIYTRSVHKFLAKEHEVPVYLRQISKKDIKKGKAMIPAAPSPSIIETNEGDLDNLSLIDAEILNMDTLQKRYTTSYKESGSGSESYMATGSLKQSSAARDNSIMKTSEVSAARRSNISSMYSEINLEELKTGIMDAVTFMARVRDVKMQGGKFVRCSVSVVLRSDFELQHDHLRTEPQSVA